MTDFLAHSMEILDTMKLFRQITFAGVASDLL